MKSLLKGALLASVTLLWTAPVFAGPDRISVLTGSRHVDPKMDFEERNPGIFLTWEGEPLDYSFGVFRNSFGKTSVSAVAGFPLAEWDRGEIAIVGGVAYYPEDGRTFAVSAGDFIPVIGLSIRHDPFAVQIMPSDGRTTDFVISFMLTAPLNW